MPYKANEARRHSKDRWSPRLPICHDRNQTVEALMSRDAFFGRVTEVQSQLGIRRNQGAWFRGQVNGNHKLLPGLLRKDERTHRNLRKYERNLMARFVRRDSRYLNTDNKWEQLAFMQHY